VHLTVATVQKLLARFVEDESAATAIEFALIAASVSIVIVAVVHILGGALTRTFVVILRALHQDDFIVVDSP
jgi:pilus assembly protein Flp/PilA